MLYTAFWFLVRVSILTVSKLALVSTPSCIQRKLRNCSSGENGRNLKQTNPLNVVSNLRISWGCIGPPAGLDVVLKRKTAQLACNRTPVLKTGASDCADEAKNNKCKAECIWCFFFGEMRHIYMLRHDVNYLLNLQEYLEGYYQRLLLLCHICLPVKT
jgi:hypothetical protein